MIVQIAFACDNNYTPHLATSVLSLLKSGSKNNTYIINILDGNISSQNKKSLEKSWSIFKNKQINYIKIKSSLFNKTEDFLHLNQTAYFRLILPNIFKNLDKILYFDCDLLFFCDVAKLYQQDLGSKLAGVVKIFHPNYQEVLKKIFPSEKIEFCFNSGVMLLNLERMRLHHTSRILLEFMNQNYDKLLTADQDILNIVLSGQVLEFSAKWNVGSYVFYAKNQEQCGLSEKEFIDIKNNPCVVHFDGSKPWSFGNLHPYHEHYYNYLNQTEFKKTKPAFNLSSLIINYGFHFSTKVGNALPDSVYAIFEKKYLKNNFLNKRYQQIIDDNKTWVYKQQPLLFRILRYLWRLIYSITNLPHEFISNKHSPEILNDFETLEKIAQGHSLARYGDGELELILGNSIPFQKADDKLQVKLNEILKNNYEKLLIGIPNTFAKLGNLTLSEMIFWRIFMSRRRSFLTSSLELKKTYYSAFVTRPYMRYQNKANAKKIFEAWKNIWHNKSVLIVEGEGTRFGIGNNLLDNAKTVNRIVAPSCNAFLKYDLLLNSILSNSNYDLVLIALGPTATVVASDLAKKGIWAIDIGHLDIEYEWYIKGSKKRVAIENKAVLETGNYLVKVEKNEKYKKQILISLV